MLAKIKKMSPGAISLLGFIAYTMPTALGFFFCPNFVLSLFGVPPTDEPYIRSLGMLFIIICVYYYDAALMENKVFMKRSAQARYASGVVDAYFAFSGIGPVGMYFFAFMEFLTATWTWVAMKKS